LGILAWGQGIRRRLPAD